MISYSAGSFSSWINSMLSVWTILQLEERLFLRFGVSVISGMMIDILFMQVSTPLSKFAEQTWCEKEGFP